MSLKASLGMKLFTVVHGRREGKIVWSRPEIVVMITLGRENLMQHMLLEVHKVTEQCMCDFLFFDAPCINSFTCLLATEAFS